MSCLDSQCPAASQSSPELANYPASMLQSTYQTAVGQHSTIDLADGSVLRINTNSLVNVEFSSSQRLIHLIKGEIYIDVAHDTSRPLSVIVDDTVFQAVGTAFNVKKSVDESIELLVTKGKVLIAELDELNPLVQNSTDSQTKLDQPINKGTAAIPGDKVVIN